METIKQVLMRRDGLTAIEADNAIKACKADLYDRLDNGEMPMDICEEYFGLEPDFLMELM